MNAAVARSGSSDPGLEDPDFRSARTWSLKHVYNHRVDDWLPLLVDAGHTDDGPVIRIGEHQFTLAEIAALIDVLRAAVAHLDANRPAGSGSEDPEPPWCAS